MRIKELVYIVAGLVVGIAVGTFVLGNKTETTTTTIQVAGFDGQIPDYAPEELAAAQSRVGDQFGTSHLITRPSDIDLSFYRMSVSDIQDWFDSLDEEVRNAAVTAAEDTAAVATGDTGSSDSTGVDINELVSGMTDISSAAEFVLYLDTETTSANEALAALYTALLNQTGSEDRAVTVCLGVDSNPYAISGPGLYLYVEVPQAESQDFKDTEAWEQLPGPSEEGPLWLAECYEPPEQTAE